MIEYIKLLTDYDLLPIENGFQRFFDCRGAGAGRTGNDDDRMLFRHDRGPPRVDLIIRDCKRLPVTMRGIPDLNLCGDS